ncbi:MAG: Flagellar hook-length control protein FliK [Pelotomaculum sp. PtaU1.Bin035]|nr:MAG: Flagellar hook-length control protein FliK [Pelotomaculum sp. PtaU1.Bin035]
MQITVVNDTAVSLKSSGSVSKNQAATGEFDSAMAALMALLNPLPADLGVAFNGPGFGRPVAARVDSVCIVDPSILPEGLLESIAVKKPETGMQGLQPAENEKPGDSAKDVEQTLGEEINKTDLPADAISLQDPAQVMSVQNQEYAIYTNMLFFEKSTVQAITNRGGRMVPVQFLTGAEKAQEDLPVLIGAFQPQTGMEPTEVQAGQTLEVQNGAILGTASAGLPGNMAGISGNDVQIMGDLQTKQAQAGLSRAVQAVQDGTEQGVVSGIQPGSISNIGGNDVPITGDLQTKQAQAGLSRAVQAVQDDTEQGVVSGMQPGNISNIGGNDVQITDDLQTKQAQAGLSRAVQAVQDDTEQGVVSGIQPGNIAGISGNDIQITGDLQTRQAQAGLSRTVQAVQDAVASGQNNSAGEPGVVGVPVSFERNSIFAPAAGFMEIALAPEENIAPTPAAVPEENIMSGSPAITEESVLVFRSNKDAVYPEQVKLKPGSRGRQELLEAVQPWIMKQPPVRPENNNMTLNDGLKEAIAFKETKESSEIKEDMKIISSNTEAVRTGDGTKANRPVENTAQSNSIQSNSVPFTPTSAESQKGVALPDLKDRLVQEIKNVYYSHKGEPQTRVQLKLEPEQLGKLTIKLYFHRGELSAHFYTGNDAVKEVLEGSLQQLRDSLSQQDLKLNDAFVFVGDGGRGGTGHYDEGKNRNEIMFHNRYNYRADGENRVEKEEAVRKEPAPWQVNYLI